MSTRTTPYRGRRPSTPRGFTLVELLIVVGIVFLLVAITVSATLALTERSEVRQTESTLKLLDLAVAEWEQQAERKLTWGFVLDPDVDFYDVNADTPHVYTLTEVLRRIRKTASVREALAQIDPRFTYTYDDTVAPPAWLPSSPDPEDPDLFWNPSNPRDEIAEWNGELAILDPWGTPIRAVHPGRVFGDGGFPDFNDPTNGTPDGDGTVFIDRGGFGAEANQWNGAEFYYGRAEGRRVLFVSAGPDRKWGNLDPVLEGTLFHEQAEDNVYSYEIEHH